MVSLQPVVGEDHKLAKPNYQFAKRQRDLAKKQKKEEKLQRKKGTQDSPPAENPPLPPGEEKTLP